ncbi:Lipase 1 [Halotydeus destructor]|nr:Lipase 1 [Halotydeus destructor]
MIPRWPLAITLIHLVELQYSANTDVPFYTCKFDKMFCYGGYEKADQGCIDKQDCYSILIGSTENGTSTWNLFFSTTKNIKTTDQLIFSRQSSHVTLRNAIVFESDNPKAKRSPCVYVTLDGRQSACSRSEHVRIFNDLPARGQGVNGPNGTKYVGYHLKSADVLTFPTRCSRLYFVAPTKEKTSITMRRLQYDNKTVISDVNFDLIDVFGMGLQDGRTDYTPECYLPPKFDKVTTTTVETTQQSTSTQFTKTETTTGGATSPKVLTSLIATGFLVFLAIFAILAIYLYEYFDRKEYIKDGASVKPMSPQEHTTMSIADVLEDEFNYREVTDFTATIPEIVESRGYDCEIHTTVTPDEYIQVMWRIVNPLTRENGHNKPVLIRHGLLYDSKSFVSVDVHGDLGDGDTSGPIDRSLGLALARRGYDVWLADWRGTDANKGHVYLTKEYWDFSLDDIFDDVRIIYDYILKVTKKKTLAYVCHSYGCASAFAVMAKNKRYVKKVKPFIALAPCVEKMNQPIIEFLAKSPLAEPLRHSVELPGPFFISSIYQTLSTFCIFPPGNLFCVLFDWLELGYSGSHLLLEKTYGLGIRLTSNIVFNHNLQNQFNGFHYYDYLNVSRNVEKYGTEKPPRYHLERSNNQYLAVFYTQDDIISPPGRVEAFMKQYKGRIIFKRFITSPNFTHGSFIASVDANELVYRKIIDLLDDYAN